MAARHAKRRRPPRQTKKRLLVVVEGDKDKSEQAYLQRLDQYLRPGGLTPSFKVVPAGGEPTRVLKKCLQYLEKDGYDLACLVVDRDKHQRLGEVIRQAKANKIGKKHFPIHVLVTNPQFELWLLWHVEDQRAFISSSDLEKRVERANLVVGKSGKSLSPKFPIERFRDAVKRAEACSMAPEPWQMGTNPYSGLPWLVKVLETGQLPSD